jgi:hypothetical protein
MNNKLNTTPLLVVALNNTTNNTTINKQPSLLITQSPIAIINPSTISVSALAILTCTIFFITIILSWLGFGLTYGNLFPLPTISTTWDYPPFNFISRIVVGIGATSFVLLHLTIYYATQDKMGSCPIEVVEAILDKNVNIDGLSHVIRKFIREHKITQSGLWNLIDFQQNQRRHCLVKD